MTSNPYDTRAAFDAGYRLDVEPWGHPNTRPSVQVGYLYCGLSRYARVRAEYLRERLGLLPGARVLLLGAGFGWTAEGLAKLGVEVVSTDTSSYVHAAKATCECEEIAEAVRAAGLDPEGEGRTVVERINRDLGRACPCADGGAHVPRALLPILDEDLITPESRKRLLEAAGGPFDWAVSEDVLSLLSEEEARALHAAMAEVARQVAHVLAPDGPAGKPGGETSLVRLEGSRRLSDYERIIPGAKILVYP